MLNIIHIILLALIFLFLFFAIYDEFILRYRKGKTTLSVNLKRANRLDGAIFIGLICIIFYQQGSFSGDAFITYLLSFLMVISFYVYFIRVPKLLFKEAGFFFADFFIPYERIQSMRLTEDGLLMLKLEIKEICINVCNVDDLEKIYTILTGLDYSYGQDSEQNK